MKFSVVTPTRNNLDKLKCCIGSVRGQAGVDVEHLVQDALSTDGTGEWLARQPGVGGVSEADAGMYDAIQRGWQRSRGDIVSWLNSDEQYLPGTLQRVQRAFEANPQIDFLYGSSIIVGPQGEPLAARREIPLRHVYVRNGTLYAYSCTLFFRRRLLDAGLLQFDKKLRYAADADLMLRVLAERRPFLRLPEYLSLFMLDGSNLSCSPRMLEEMATVQARHGAARSALSRKALLLGRSFEKLFAGAFASDDLSYRFAVDETPNYREVAARSVPARFRIDHFAPVAGAAK